jgi:hypothetical protein
MSDSDYLVPILNKVFRILQWGFTKI